LLDSTENMAGEVEVWSGHISDGDANENVVITKGQINTHITVATNENIYTVILNNTTGRGTFINEGELSALAHPFEDGLTPPAIADTLPALD
jgi:hypothetical protein